MRKLTRFCLNSKSHTVARSNPCCLALFCLALCAPAIMKAQTLHVLHAFSGGTDGIYPESSFSQDRAGNLYGTTNGGRGSDYGTVYELMRHDSSWIFKTLYSFHPQNDGQNPDAPVIFGPDGLLYGTTPFGGNTCSGHYCGTVYNVQPPPRACANILCSWNENQVYWFGLTRLNDGFVPGTGPLLFDSAGNIYGTTQGGGLTGNGTVFELSRTQGGWAENILYNFPGEGRIADPVAGVTFDSAGNLYGTVMRPSFGSVYELVRNGEQWTEQTLYTFQGGNDGGYPWGGVIFDSAGNLYGTTAGLNQQPGTVFELSPQGDGTWRETVLHTFNAGGIGPKTNLAMDSAGNLYGTTQGLGGGDQFGSVFKLTNANGAWTFSWVYHFTNGADGSYPVGGVTVDAAGNLYGTCVSGGADGYGTAWEITP